MQLPSFSFQPCTNMHVIPPFSAFRANSVPGKLLFFLYPTVLYRKKNEIARGDHHLSQKRADYSQISAHLFVSLTKTIGDALPNIITSESASPICPGHPGHLKVLPIPLPYRSRRFSLIRDRFSRGRAGCSMQKPQRAFLRPAQS